MRIIQKKGQTEIMGLAIIILLITIGLLFVFKFLNAQPKNQLKQEFVDTKLASNMLSVILRTTLDCKQIEIKDLYQDCAEGITHVDYCGTNDPCLKANQVVKEILEKTLEEWNKAYRFTAKIGTGASSEITTIVHLDCTPENIGIKYSTLESETYPMPTDRGTLLIELQICR